MCHFLSLDFEFTLKCPIDKHNHTVRFQAYPELRRHLLDVVECDAKPNRPAHLRQSFCAGADISEMTGTANAESSYRHAREFQILFDQVESLPQPVIAAVSGWALGGGCELALACDFRVASDNARFGLPEIKIGAFPGGGGTQRLSRLIGIAKAKEMILTGDPITAQEALAIGLVMKVASKEGYLAEASSFAAKLAALPRSLYKPRRC